MQLSALHNDVIELPSEIGKLKKSTRLNIPQNKLAELPIEIGKLNNLRVLNVRENQLKSLPPEIGNLKKLASLDISCNKLMALPPEIGKLKNLRELYVNNLGWEGSSEGENKISDLPKEILQLTKLEKLDLRGNPLSIPPEILEKYDEPQTILNYYYSIFGVRKREIPVIHVEKIDFLEPLNEIKLLMVGQGSVGKTSLAQRILHGTFDPEPN